MQNKKNDFRCPVCGTLIFRMALDGVVFIEYYCKKCRKTRIIRLSQSDVFESVQIEHRVRKDDNYG